MSTSRLPSATRILTVVLAVGCGDRPRPQPPAPVQLVAPRLTPTVARRAPPEVRRPELVRLPRWFERAAYPAAPPLTVDDPPPSSVTPTLLRPLAGGDALRLADLALARHDARDAIAQYRALLVDPPLEVRPYVELQLARAYLELAEPELAEPLLRRVVASESAASRPAVFELAALLVADPRHEAIAILRELEPHAGDMVQLLEDHLLSRAPGAHLTALSDFVLQRTEDPTRACVVDRRLREVAPIPELPPLRVCPDKARPPSARSPDQQGSILTVVSMRFAGELARPSTTAARWVSVAVEASRATSVGPATPLTELTSWVVVAACHNASMVARHQGVRVTPTWDQLVMIRSGVIVPHRPYLESIIAPWSLDAPD